MVQGTGLDHFVDAQASTFQDVSGNTGYYMPRELNTNRMDHMLNRTQKETNTILPNRLSGFRITSRLQFLQSLVFYVQQELLALWNHQSLYVQA